MPTILTIAALCILDAEGRLLLVRKRGTSRFMQPGGKVESGETPAAAAVRELAEELGLISTEADLQPLGTWHGMAANEQETWIDATVFRCKWRGKPYPAAEIQEIAWLNLDEAQQHHNLAPLLTEFVIPRLVRRQQVQPSAGRD